MLNLHNDPDISREEAAFAEQLVSMLAPIQMLRTQTITQSDQADESYEPSAVIPSLSTRRFARPPRRRFVTGALLAGAAAFALVGFVITRPQHERPLTALYDASPSEPTQLQYLPVNLPDGFSIASIERTEAPPLPSVTFFVGRQVEGKLRNFVQIKVDTLSKNSGDVGNDQRFTVDGRTFASSPASEGMIMVSSKLDECGSITALGGDLTRDALARLTSIIRCDDGRPVAWPFQDYELLYQMPTDFFVGFKVTVAKSRREVAVIRVPRQSPMPDELQSVLAKLTPTTTPNLGSIQVGQLRAYVSRILAPETGAVLGTTVTAFPVDDPESRIFVVSSIQADALAVTGALQPVDNQTWDATLKQFGVAQ
jgi:hypothetical protein